MDFNKPLTPKTLSEAVDVIIADMRPEDKAYVLENGVATVHHGFGMALRNGWGLWHDSELAQHFKTQFGLGHADDMSGMILSAVEATLRGVTFDAPTEAARYHRYWRLQNIDPLTLNTFTESA